MESFSLYWPRKGIFGDLIFFIPVLQSADIIIKCAIVVWKRSSHQLCKFLF